MVGAVAGTPGTLPTNWTTSLAGGVSREIVGIGTANGINYIDIRIFGTTTNTNLALNLVLEGNTIAAAVGQVWTSSAWVSLVGGTTTGITNVYLTQTERSSGGTDLAYLNGTSFLSTINSNVRRTYSPTLSNASTAFIVPSLWVTHTGIGAAVDFTLRIGLPQLEQGAFATSVIPTTTTALTRAQDRAVVNTISPWYNSVAGTIYAEFSLTLPASGGNQFFTQTSDNSYNNRIVNNISSTAFPNTSTVSGGTSDGFASTAGAVTANTTVKVAAAYASNDLAISLNGGTVATDNTVTIPSGLTRFDLGSDHLGFNNVKAGYLRRITYYPTRLSNAQLQAITA